MAHSRSFLANQKARNTIFGAENLLMGIIWDPCALKFNLKFRFTLETRVVFYIQIEVRVISKSTALRRIKKNLRKLHNNPALPSK